MTSLFQKKWAQDFLVYGGIGLFLLFVIFTLVNSFTNAVDPVTSGEVHWHAEISYEACGQEVSFDDQKGHTLTHGHNDDLVHVEGVVLDEDDITLAAFFKNAGIDITADHFEERKNGDQCNFSSDPGAVAFYVDGDKFSDPNEIIVADKQEIKVIFE